MAFTEHERAHERRRRLAGWAAVGMAAAVTAVALGACAGKHKYTKYDRQANEESLECARSPDLSPPAGRYEDRGVELDWDRLVNPKDPMSHDIDMGYVEAVIEDPDKLEQVYYEATHGHARASFLACQYEVGARVMGRNVARFVSSFKCTSVVTCEVHVDELPISDETASGQRLLTFMAKEFEREATKRGAIAEIIGYVMVMAAGPKVTKRVRPSGPIMIPRVRGPGRWVRVNESMSARARAYQERITRHTSKEAYEVGGVRFDGYRRGVLIEAKGPGYAKFIKDGKFMRYFSGRHRLFEQANRQRGAAGNHPIEWHIAEQELAEMLRRVFRRRNITGIRVIHTP